MRKAWTRLRSSAVSISSIVSNSKPTTLPRFPTKVPTSVTATPSPTK
ncbi:secreted protein [gut metagenome]|uniref:Secreted protein n=1 Tax=gut metagenome TaxID=749906 RepID=J9GMN9_9ZZZZ